MSAHNEEVATLRAALAEATTELATMKVQYGDAAQDKARRAQEQQRKQLQESLDATAREVEKLDESSEAVLKSLQAVAFNSAIELHAGYVSNSAESIQQVNVLAKQYGDYRLAHARKLRQLESSRARIAAMFPPAPEPALVEAV